MLPVRLALQRIQQSARFGNQGKELLFLPASVCSSVFLGSQWIQRLNVSRLNSELERC